MNPENLLNALRFRLWGSKKRKLSKKNKLNENKVEMKNICGGFINFAKIGEQICNVHN